MPLLVDVLLREELTTLRSINPELYRLRGLFVASASRGSAGEFLRYLQVLGMRGIQLNSHQIVKLSKVFQSARRKIWVFNPVELRDRGILVAPIRRYKKIMPSAYHPRKYLVAKDTETVERELLQLMKTKFKTPYSDIDINAKFRLAEQLYRIEAATGLPIGALVTTPALARTAIKLLLFRITRSPTIPQTVVRRLERLFSPLWYKRLYRRAKNVARYHKIEPVLLYQLAIDLLKRE